MHCFFEIMWVVQVSMMMRVGCMMLMMRKGRMMVLGIHSHSSMYILILA